MSTGSSMQPLMNLVILSGCAAAVIFLDLVVLCWDYLVGVPTWVTRTEYFLSQAVLLALFIAVIHLRMNGTVYVRIQIVVLVLVLGVLVSLSGILGFPSASRVRYVAAISSAFAPLMLLIMHRVE
jgi:hypothetical protein